MGTTNEILSVRTPEQVGFRYLLAGLGTRATAFLLDLAIRAVFILFILVIVLLLSRWLPALDPTGILAGLDKTWILALGVLAYAVVDLGYFLIFEALWNGQTPGKRLHSLRVVRINGKPIGWLESALRNILRAADLLLGFYPLGLVVMFLSPRSQRLGDYAAGTVVIVERRQKVPVDRTRLRTSARHLLPDLEVHLSTLQSKQYRLLKSFLERRHQMDQAHRRHIAGLLAQGLMKHWGLSAKGIPCEPFLEEVVGAYERSRRAL